MKMKNTIPVLLASLCGLLCSCVIPVPVPKTQTKRTAHFDTHYAELYFKNGIFYFVDRYEEKQMALPIDQIARIPYAPESPEFSVITIEDQLEEISEVSIYDEMQPIRFQFPTTRGESYTLGKERGEGLNPIRREELPLNRLERVERKQLLDGERYAVFAISDLREAIEVEEGKYHHENHRNLYLLRSSKILPNGSYSAVFQLNPSYGKRLDVGFPVIGPDIMGGGTSVNISPGLSEQ